MSANNAVTVLRSPSIVEASGCSGVTRIPGAVDAARGELVTEGNARPASAVPHSSQNLDVGLLSAAHFGQRLDSGPPHSAQNFLAPMLSVPHFEQRIDLSLNESGRLLLYHPTSATNQRGAEERSQNVPITVLEKGG